MPEYFRLGMTKEEINETLQTAVLEPKPVVAGNFAAFTEDGQIIDSEKSATDFAPAPLTENLILYVNAESGSNSNDGLAVERAKKTIMGAINNVPKDLGAYNAKVVIASGNYSETINISGFYGRGAKQVSGLILQGEEGTIINGHIFVDSDSAIFFQDLSVHGPISTSYSKLHLERVSITDTSEFSLTALDSELIAFDLKIQNSEGNGIRVGGSSFLNELSGNVSGIGVIAGINASGTPGLIVIGKNSINAGTKYQKVRGGVIIENGVLI